MYNNFHRRRGTPPLSSERGKPLRAFVHFRRTYTVGFRGGNLHVLLQVPANRIGFTVLSLAQLKIMQEVITLAVFVPFAVLYMGEPIKLDYLWAGLCLMGAVYFIFRA